VSTKQAIGIEFLASLPFSRNPGQIWSCQKSVQSLALRHRPAELLLDEFRCEFRHAFALASGGDPQARQRRFRQSNRHIFHEASLALQG
jgi:hypothetical protein